VPLHLLSSGPARLLLGRAHCVCAVEASRGVGRIGAIRDRDTHFAVACVGPAERVAALGRGGADALGNDAWAGGGDIGVQFLRGADVW